jgi:nitroreductase
MTEASPRRPDADVDRQFIERHSRRALAPEPLEAATIASLFEAARWAPSSFNAQPWLFLYADGREHLAVFQSLLRESNRAWAAAAPLLVFAFAKRHHDGVPNRSAAFDCGAAFMSLALQAHKLGLSARAMGGILHDRIHETLGVSRDDYDALCAIAIGKPVPVDRLSAEQRRSEHPSSRKPLTEVARRWTPR